MNNMKLISIIMCNDMHMDIERVNELISHIHCNKNYKIICDYTKADLVIIITCAFGEGRKNSMYKIADVQKNAKQSSKIIVTGCLVSTNKEELEKIEGIVIKKFEDLKKFFIKNTSDKEICYRQFIKQNVVVISSGCLKKCNYCVYSLISNNYISKSKEQILKEVEELYNEEITIYISGGLETSDYGIDLYGKRSIASLLDEICTKYPNCNYVIGWFHPSGITTDFLKVLEKNKNITEIMMHIQHVDNKILKSMGRETFESIDLKINKLKEIRPDIRLSTEVIVGFPGEGEKEFQKLVEYLDKSQFEDIAVASYEPVKGTKAYNFYNENSKEVRKSRMEYISRRYKAHKYPEPEDNNSLLENYNMAIKDIRDIPMILTEKSRQKYPYIAGTDTTKKMQMERIISDTFEKIVNVRDEITMSKLKNWLHYTYTEEFRKYLYLFFKKTNSKISTKAKKILL